MANDEEKKNPGPENPEPHPIDENSLDDLLPEVKVTNEESEVTSDEINDEKISPAILEDVIHRKDAAKLTEIFTFIPDADIAEAASELENVTDLIYLFRNTPSKNAAALFDELDQDTKEKLIAAMTDKELVKLVNEQSADDVADVVGDMPANLARKVLKAADADMRADINKLLKYADDTAGAIMTTEYLELKEGLTVSKAIETIRKIGKDAETVYTLFLCTDRRKFAGTVNLDDLIFASGEQKLSEIMSKDAPYVHVNTDKEEVANMMAKYDLNALAVLNDDECLVGIVTIDDAIDVAVEEANEDLAHFSKMATADAPYMDTSIWRNAKRCFPWLIGLIVLGTFTTMVLNRLEAQQIFTALPILISFVPTLMDTGGNAGGQTTGLMIRGLATKEFGPRQTLQVAWKELRSALLIALFVGVFAFVWITIECYTGIVSLGVVTDTNGMIYDFSNISIWNGSAFRGPLAGEFAIHTLTFSGLVALTMFVAISASKVVGTLLCMGAAAIKKDPALLAQPLLTTVMDVLTLLIYFAMACVFFPAFA